MKRCLLAICLAFLACNELPVGSDELRQRGDFDPEFIDLSLFSSFTEYKNMNVGRSYNLVFGKNDEYESRVMLTFNFPDTVYDGYDEIKLTLYASAAFENDTVLFSIHLMDTAFVEYESNWTRRKNDEAWTTAGGDFVADSIRAGVGQGDSIVLYFNYLELAQIQTAPAVIIVPRDTGFFYLSSREGGKTGLISMRKNDVVLTAAVETDCHIINGPEPTLFEDWMGSGWVCRDYVRFNYDTLLDGSMAVYAELTFRCAEYFTHRDSIELGVWQLPEPFSTFDIPTGSLIALEKIAAGDTLVTIDIVKYAERIIAHPDSNFGFYVNISPENYDITRIKVVRGSHRLNIGYVLPPEPR